MPFCPKCRYEYLPEVLVCPDCEEQLVDVLLPENEKESDDVADESPDENAEGWVPVALLTSVQYADLLEEALRSKGIPIIIRSGAGHFGPIGTTGPSSIFPISAGYLVLIGEDFLVDADREAAIILGDLWDKSKLIDIGE
ncbi:MAG: hypothetical protein CVT49_09715 [candidate division Zixibacteria bacterium HGW-Zixibacteria-1]|nr:MAG: hypothetical protein CVT49_09715 [candidate division Zixibacteria bacterium HGW-Zixibacteria-1]